RIRIYGHGANTGPLRFFLLYSQVGKSGSLRHFGTDIVSARANYRSTSLNRSPFRRAGRAAAYRCATAPYTQYEPPQVGQRLQEPTLEPACLSRRAWANVSRSR